MRKLLLMIIAVSVLCTALTGCTQKTDDESPAQNPADTVIVAIMQDFDSLDPHKASATGTQEVMFNIFTALINIAPDGQIVPELALSYEVSDDSLTYTFALRRDVIFHNGQKMTAADVLYSYNRLMGKTDDQTQPLSSELINTIASVEAVDDYTVVFHLLAPDSSFIAKCLYAVIPENSGSIQAEFPTGAGPFRFVSYTPGIGIKMAKNDDFYVPGVPSLENVEFRVFSDANAGILALRNGEIQIMNVLSANLSAVPDSFDIISAPQNMVQLLGLNNAFEPFSDLRVRQALNYAIDKEQIIEMMSPGSARIGTNFSPVMAYYYNPETENLYPRDTDKSRQLLAEAGYEDLTFTVRVPSEYQFHVNAAVIIQQQLAEAGITMNIETVEWNAWLTEVYGDRRYEATLVGLTGKIDPVPVVIRYRSDYNRNFINYSNPAYDALIRDAQSATDEALRADIVKRAQMILAEDAASVYIMDPSVYFAVDKKLGGFNTYPIGYLDMKSLFFK